MRRHAGGGEVRGGYYWNLHDWELVPVPGESGTLPGSSEKRYVAVPFPAVVVIVPLMATLHVFSMPIVGFALTFYAGGRALLRLASPRSPGTPTWPSGRDGSKQG